MNTEIPAAVLAGLFDQMKEADIVKFVSQSDGAIFIGKGENLLREIVASGETQSLKLATLKVPNLDAAAFVTAFYCVQTGEAFPGEELH